MKSKTEEKDSKKKSDRQPKAAKPKTEEYIMKKNTGMKVLRAIFWIILIFILSGVWHPYLRQIPKRKRNS